MYGWFNDIQNCPIVRAECLKTIDIQSIYICKHWVCTWNIHGKNVGITFVGAFFCCPYCSNSTKTRMDATLSQEFFRFLENFDFTTNCKCKNEKSSIHDIWYTELKSIFFLKVLIMPPVVTLKESKNGMQIPILHHQQYKM